MLSSKLLPVLYIILGIILLNIISQYDLKFSQLFYDQIGHFYLKNSLLVRILHKLAIIIGILFAIGIAYQSFAIYIKTRSLKFANYKNIIYILLVCLIGPVLTVHYVIKDYVGRPRPNELIEFSGQYDYQSFLTVSSLCNNDCSFPSGHAAAGFTIFALAFLYKHGTKHILNAIAVLAGTSIGLARIIEGDHFLSDIVASGLIIYTIALILSLLIKPNHLDSKTIDV